MNDSTQFGKLESVPLRQAWPHEASDFTPWLSENLEQLSKVLEIPLELVDSEVGVEEFSADILARNPTDDTRVLIENQLENSNHTHLGQILTYLAGLDARTVVWIASSFTSAHLSALRWLNDHTSDQFAFFAVQVKVVQIADSPMAPVFEIRERPSEWEIYVRSVSTEPLSDVAQFRRDFWAFYSERHPDDLDLKPGFRNSNVYHLVDDLNVWISQYLAPSSRRVGMYIIGQDGESVEAVRDRLLPYEDRVQEELGIRTVIGNTSRHFAPKVLGDIEPVERENWPRISDWFHKNLAAYQRALTEPPV